jgi:membrane protein DedA with SNARE-associated domain
MEEYIERLIEALSQLDPLWTYGFLLLSAFLENVIPPVPGDTVVVFSAYLVGRGALDWQPVYLTTCTGGTLGFMTMYYLGYKRGRAFFSKAEGRFFSHQNMAKAEQWLDKYGKSLILANRFLSGIRSVIAIAAGIGGMNWKQVAVYGLISMGIWNGLLLYAGLMLGQNWTEAVNFLGKYNRFWALFLAAVLGWVLLRYWRKRRSAKS